MKRRRGKIITGLRIFFFGIPFLFFLFGIYIMILVQAWRYLWGILILIVSFVMLFCMFFLLMGRWDLFNRLFGTFIMFVGFFLTGVSISLLMKSLISGREDSGLLNISVSVSILLIYAGFKFGYSKKISHKKKVN